MIAFDALWGVFFFLLLLSFPLLLLLGTKFFKEREKKRYSFLNGFPFELFGLTDGERRKNGSHVFLIIYLFTAFTPLTNILPHMKDCRGLLPYVLLLAVFAILTALLFLTLLLIPARFLKAHVLLVTLYFLFVMIMTGANAVLAFFLAFQSPFDPGIRPVHLTLAVCATLLLLAMMILSFDPRLKSWTKLEPVTDPKGELSYRRPKRFPLAYTEWAMILGHYLTMLLFLLILLRY